MGIDFQQHRMKIGLFNLQSRSSRIRYPHTDSLGPGQTMMMYTLLISVILVTYASQTEPSPFSSLDTQTNCHKCTASQNSTEFSTNPPQYLAIQTLLNRGNWSPTYVKYYDISPYKQTPSLSPNALLGNSLAHYYYGNIGPENATRKPKFPCTRCEKNIASNSKAISCDLCNNWTHIKCSRFMSVDKYNQLTKTNSTFAYICNRCTIETLPNSSALQDTSPENTLPITNVKSSDPTNYPIGLLQQKGLHFVGINTRSLLPKIDELRLFAHSNKSSIICISESWLDNSISNNEIEIPDYSIERCDRNRNGGGVCLYIRNTLAYNSRIDLHYNNLEAIWIDLLLPKTRPILIGSIYRPPKQSDFLDNFDTLMECLHLDQEKYIIGDVSICD